MKVIFVAFGRKLSDIIPAEVKIKQTIPAEQFLAFNNKAVAPK
jgi:hypothetical protein